MMILNMEYGWAQSTEESKGFDRRTKITIATFDCVTDILGEIVEKRSLILSSTLQA